MKEKIYAMIPARIGSQRLKMKNLALIDGKPLIYFSIQASKKTKLFNKVIINSDHVIFSKIANRYNVDFYLRPKSIGLSKTKSDDVVYNFGVFFNPRVLGKSSPATPSKFCQRVPIYYCTGCLSYVTEFLIQKFM